MIFWQKIEKIGFFLFKSDFFDLNRFFDFFDFFHILKSELYPKFNLCILFLLWPIKSFEWVINLIDKILNFHVKHSELNYYLTNKKE